MYKKKRNEYTYNFHIFYENELEKFQFDNEIIEYDEFIDCLKVLFHINELIERNGRKKIEIYHWRKDKKMILIRSTYWNIFLKNYRDGDDDDNDNDMIKLKMKVINDKENKDDDEFEMIEKPNIDGLLDNPCSCIKRKVVFEKINLVSLLEIDFQLNGVKNQFKRDIMMWKETLNQLKFSKDDKNINKMKYGILKRLFVVIKYGGLMYKSDKNNVYKPWDYPVCTAISHGSRILIQLPKINLQTSKHLKLNKEHYRNGFWNWFLTGDPSGSSTSSNSKCVSPFDVISFTTSGNECKNEKKVIFKRITSSHSIENLDEVIQLPYGRKKLIKEIKHYSIRSKDTKLINFSKEYIYSHHKHWAMNIAIGGINNYDFFGNKIMNNGEFGSMYIYHSASKNQRYGGLLIGVETCEYGKRNKMGKQHTIKAKSCKFSPTYGYKWKSTKDKELDLSQKVDVPTKNDGMIIDLSHDWTFLIDKVINNWDDNIISEKIEMITPIKKNIQLKEVPENVDNGFLLL